MLYEVITSDKKLWGGRFTKSTNAAVDDFNSSIRFDQRLYYFDIMGSIAHAEMLGKQNIISSDDADKIVNGLKEVMEDIESGTAEFDISAEDIHMNVEKLLTEKIGEPAKKLHTARSRNDQVAVDAKMYTKDIADKIKSQLIELIAALTTIAKENLYTIIRITSYNVCYTKLLRAVNLDAARDVFRAARQEHREAKA